MTSRSTISALLITGLVIAVAYSGANEFYLSVFFNIGVYYIAATGFNILVGQTGQKSLDTRASLASALTRLRS